LGEKNQLITQQQWRIESLEKVLVSEGQAANKKLF